MSMGKLEEKSGLETAKIVLVVFLPISRVFAIAFLGITVRCTAVGHIHNQSITLKASECLESKVAKLMRSRRALGFPRHEF